MKACSQSVLPNRKTLFFFNLIIYFTLQYCIGFAIHWLESTMDSIHMCPPSWTPSLLPPHPIPLGHPSAPALSTLSHASSLDWWFISHMIIYMFQCHSPISSCPRPHPQSPKDCSIHLCLFFCLAYRVIITERLLLNPGKDAWILGLWRRIQSRARDDAWLLRAFVQ